MSAYQFSNRQRQLLEELRTKTPDEIRIEIKNGQEALFNKRYQIRTEQVENVSEMKDLRRKVARLKTVLKEKLEA